MEYEKNEVFVLVILLFNYFFRFNYKIWHSIIKQFVVTK